MSSWTSGYVAEIGYTHGFYRELTPALLSMVGLVAGARVTDPSSPLAYCELGCGQGLSANLLAAANPHIQVYATDFNPGHVVNARPLAAEAGLSNVRFYDHSFGEFLDEPGLPEFDVISLHGIYSWIAPEHRATIVEFIRRKLKPGGLVYISYNALPGWAAAMPLRQLMADHAATSYVFEGDKQAEVDCDPDADDEAAIKAPGFDEAPDAEIEQDRHQEQRQVT